ncbi:PREDICTED: L-type lectin-domain containing receptor kinase V.9-like [Nelumbo nucifera]|uniref:non-specific serine/threonine protein kinase n=2 Tax=Nelumbo nucifera TaxID=4432 RepID=A0A822Z8S6_NELNU|nr:PREDICTED: L-type lectin-domain containing receptor kinase V.9-like [Nelumbo nucifera]DAD42744.1 TPA_asm: hypothetical protein HUJ06_000974 [Nelumbo nucifera]
MCAAMSCVLKLLPFILLLYLNHASAQAQDGFIFYGFDNKSLELNGNATVGDTGYIRLTHSDGPFYQKGRLFYSLPLQIKNSSNGSVFSFSTTFVVAFTKSSQATGDGMAFVISPTKDPPGAMPSQFLGLFNITTNLNPNSHIVAVELDTIQTPEFSDIDNNHVGIDFNGLISNVSATAGYYSDDNGGGLTKLLFLSGDPLQLWVEYDGAETQLNVTIAPAVATMTKPKRPLLSLKQDLSEFLLEEMYVGFSASFGAIRSDHDVLAWSFKMNGQAESLDLSRLPTLPSGPGKKPPVLPISLPFAGVVVGLLLAWLIVFIVRKIKYKEVLEDWEVQYGPHRFSYRNLFLATNGFKDKEFLGRGGFGRVYKGVLPKSKIQVAVKRISHDSTQGMREFIAEIATIGRLRHPNLVRLQGYCRRKGELLLVYDFMSNGSLDKFIFDQPKLTLNWEQRFKIIKDVASALLYLHEQWVQVIIHRDIKASNVLLDSEMNGKLGDFGLAKLSEQGVDPQTSYLAGTPGYIAPELARTGKSSTSTDLFAFGTFLLEVACGRRPVELQEEPEKVFLVDWVTDCWARGAILGTVDPKLGEEFVAEEAELVLKLGLLCSHPLAEARPTMSAVALYLEGEVRLPEDFSAKSIAEENKGRTKERAELFGSPLSERETIPMLTLTEKFTSSGR